MKTLKLEFVEFIPKELQEGVLYISMKYNAARHKCACGCGSIIITPITPKHWQLKYDGKAISLSPSIGNWSFPCQSHYWIVKNEIRWSGKWSQEQIEKGRKREQEKLSSNVVNLPSPEKKNWHWLKKRLCNLLQLLQ